MWQKKWVVVLCIVLGIGLLPTHAQTITIERVATGLRNPRGVAVLPDGRLLVAQAGTGVQTINPAKRTGTISFFEDLNADGDYDDTNERFPLVTQLASYNSLSRFESGHDEVGGVGDIVILDDGRVFYTKDDPAAEVTPRGEYRSDTGVFVVNLEGDTLPQQLVRYGTVNALTYDPQRQAFFVADSGLNVVVMVSLERQILEEFQMPTLELGQQPVPAGITYDPSTGEVLVALFSGAIRNYYDTRLPFMPGDAKIVRLNPDTGAITDEITGLTTAVDVAADEQGNLYVVEMTTTWATPNMPFAFDVFDPNAPPDPGGYMRFTGRVSLYPADGGERVILAEDLDQPTNVTYHQGVLYISTGQGTPGRPILDANGELTRLTGEIYRITLP